MTTLRKVLRSLRSSVSRNKVSGQRKGRLRNLALEPLEDRILLSLGSRLDQVFPTGQTPLGVQLGRIDTDSQADLAVLGANGQLTVALNGGANTWRSVTTVDLGVGPAHGLALTHLDDDLLLDAVIQGPSALTLARGDGTGRFTVVQTITPGNPGTLAPAGGGPIQMAVGAFNDDFLPDLATVAPGSNEILVFLGTNGGLAGVPSRYLSGASQPVAVVTGNFVGGPLPDLAVGHRDGTVTFLEGQPDGTFDLRPEFTVSGLAPVTSLAAADLNGDGSLDLAVSATSQVIVLFNAGAASTAGPLVNGDFSAGLTGWTASGPVGAGRGFAQLREGPSLLTSLRQTFTVPAGARSLSFDLVALGLEAPAGALPDAFEASLLDGQEMSLVPTIHPEATAFLNVNPGGAVSTASGVLFDGRHITLDLSGLTPGTRAALVFDLIGNPPGNGAVASVANVRVSADPAAGGFRRVVLAGPFGTTAGIASGDVDGDGRLDLVVTDSGLDRLLVYNGDGTGSFTRSEVDVSPFGTGALAVAAGPLTTGDAANEVVLTLAGSARALSPLAYDNVPPQVTILDPAPGQMVNVSPAGLRVRFSEAMSDAGPEGQHSVSNPAGYSLRNTETGRDVPLASVSYNSTTFEAILVPSAPLADGTYELAINGSDPDRALEDLAGNLLGSGTDRVAAFTVDTVAPRVEMTDPLPGQLVTTSLREIRLRFSEAVSDAGSAAPHSVTNPAGYTLLSAGANGVFEGGDDRPIPVAFVSYDPATSQAVLVLAGTVSPLADGKYQLVVKGRDRDYAIQDPAGNRLGGGTDTTFAFSVDTHAPEVTLVLTPNILWPPNHQLADVDAQITVRDQVDTSPKVTLLSITSSEPDVSPGSANFPQDIQDATPGTDDRHFRLRSEREGGGKGRIYTVSYFVQDTAGNGRVISAVAVVPHDQGGGKALLSAIGDPTPPGLGALQTSPSQLLDPPFNIGDLVSDSIAVSGEADVWTFQGTAGQRLFFDARVGSIFALHWALAGPDGTVLFSDSFSDHDTLALPSTGEYALTVDGRNGQTGSYQFKVWEVPATVVTPINLGQVVSGSIDVPGEEDHYTFSGTAGQRLFFDVQQNSSFTLGFSLLRPDGSVLLVPSNADRDVFVLPISGTYTAVAGDLGGGFLDATGSYRFQIFDVPPILVRPITFAQVVSGAIAVPGQEDHYTFTASAGQKVYFDVRSNPSGRLAFTVRRPDGTDLYSRLSADQGPFTIPATGTYRVVVADNGIFPDATGNYEFAVFDVLDPPTGLGVPDSKGTDFWLAFPGAQHANGILTLDGEVGLLITAEEDAAGQVYIPAIGFFANFSVAAGSFTRFTFPSLAFSPGTSNPEISSSNLVETRGIRVTATKEVTVYGLNQLPQSTDAYLGLPADALATEYIVLGYKNVRSASDPFASLGNGSQFAIVATADGTHVTITPSVTTGTRAAGVPYTITLNQGQTYLLRNNAPAPADLSGTIITSDRPIAVYGGHSQANIPFRSSSVYRFADQVIEQLPAVDAWGQRFVTMPLATRHNGDTFRFLAARDGTTVRVNGQVVATLNRGQLHEMLLDGPSEIAADQPILVAQYANSTEFDNVTGDPFMMLIPPAEQFQAAYTVTTPTSGFPDINYLNVIAPSEAIGSILLDGAAIPADRFVTIGTGKFAGVQVPVAVGTHRLTGPAAFGVSVYGFAPEDSYGYPGGTALSPVARVANLALTPPGASHPLATEHRVTALVTDAAGDPLRGIRVDFRVSGANETAGFSLTDASGRAEFAYIGTHQGTDTIAASQGERTASGSVTWTAPAPTLTLVSPPDGSSFPAGTTVLVTGAAHAGSPLTSLASVTVNGQPVEALDAADNFFTRVVVGPETNRFTFTATDNLGQTDRRTLTVIGTAPMAGIDFGQLQDVTVLGRLSYQNLTHNRATHTLYAEVRLTNAGADPLDGPVLVDYRFDPTVVRLANADSSDSEGRLFIAFDKEIGPGGLTAGAASGAVRLVLADPPEERFTLAARLRAPGNAAPSFASVPVTAAVVGAPYASTATATDPNGQRLAYRLEVAPAGMTIDGTTGRVAWIPTAGQVGANQVVVVADDGRGGIALQQYSVQVTVAAVNQPPLFRSVPVTRSTPGADYSYTPEVFDADGDTLYFSLDVGPAGMSADPATGRVSFSATPAGTYPVMLRVEDGRGGSAVQSWVLSVGTDTSNNRVPVFQSTPPSEAVVGTPFLYQAQATDPDGQPVRFALLAAPAGMVVEATTGRVSWTPGGAQVGSQAALLQAADDADGIAVQSFTITVYAARPNRTPVIDSRPPLLATQDQSYTYAPSAHDPDGDSLRFELLSGPPDMTIDPGTGAVAWVPAAADVGGYRVQLRATDPDGAAALQTYDLIVRGPNVAPVVTTPATTATAGVPYRAVVEATDEDALTFGLTAAPAGMTIDAHSGLLLWKPTAADLGAHAVVVRVTDERGAFSDAPFTLTVRPDTEAPSVAIVLSLNVVAPGEPVAVQVVATDNVAVSALSLMINGSPVALDADHIATFTPSGPGVVSLVATATDAAGNVGTASARLRVVDPDDTERPFLQFTGLEPGEMVTYRKEIVGSVTDPNLESYTLAYARAGTDEYTVFARGDRNVTDGVLGTFDATLLANDDYIIRLTAVDVSGNGSYLDAAVSVRGEAKLGHFRTEQTDLTVQVAGIPITIRRIYDSLEANRSGDFGFGWSLAVAEARIHETVPVYDFSSFTRAVQYPFKVGTRVYLNTPDGRRVGFTFEPEQQFGAFWAPHFRPDPGVFDTLSVDFAALRVAEDGSVYGWLLPFPYNPAGYSLTTKDGVTYRYDQFKGLQDITDRNGNVLTYTADGIFSSTGESIRFERDELGRITRIIDPAGQAITYTYDEHGDLVELKDQVGTRSHYYYLAEPAHYLYDINNATGGCGCFRSAPPMRMEYDDNGRLLTTADALGNATHHAYDLEHFSETVTDPLRNVSALTYDDRGNIVALTDPRGATTLITYNADDLPVAVRDALGFTATAEYDTRGNRTRVTDALGNTALYTYNAFDKLETTTSPLGRTSRASYDARGNLVSFVNAEGVLTSMTRDELGRQIDFTNGAGETTTFLFASPADKLPTTILHPDGTSRHLEYNFRGQVTRATDENGNELRFFYDAAGRMTSAIDQEGFATTLIYDGQHVASVQDALGRVTRFEYDEAGRLVREIDPTGGTQGWEYDADNQLVRETDVLGRSIDYTYDGVGNLVRFHLNPTWEYEHDARGNLTAVTDGNGHTTRYEYDGANRLVRATDALGGVRTYTYDAAGNLLSTTDERGNTTSFTYDRMNRTLTQTDPLGVTVAWTYDSLGNTTSFTDGNGHTTRYEYDTRTQVTYRYDVVELVQTDYYRSRLVGVTDAEGARTGFDYDGVGNLTRVTDALGRSTEYSYDGRGKVTSITDPLGGQFLYGYDAAGNLTSYTDALGRTTAYTYDDLNQLASATDPLGGVTQFVINGAGQLTSQTDALGHTTAYTLNALDLRTAVTDPMGGVTRFEYDGVGSIVAVTDPAGERTSYNYDALDRLVRTVDPLGGTWDYTYDAAGNRTSQRDPAGQVLTYAHDAANQPVSTTDGQGGVTRYAFDGIGNLTSLTDPAGNTTHYVYDAVDQLVRETDPLGHSRLYSYDLVGNLTEVTDRNGLRRTFDYDARDRETEERWWQGATPARTLSYTYDAVDNLLSAADPDSTYHFTYDALDRLSSADNLGTPRLPRVVLSYGFDAVGNLTSVRDDAGVEVRSTYNANDWLVSRTWAGPGIDPARAEFTYNARGGLTGIRRFADAAGTRLVSQSALVYDAVGRLTELTHADASNQPLVQYQYERDAAGQLVRETHHGRTTTYRYDSTGQLVAADHTGQSDENYTYDAAGNRTGGDYVTGPGNRVLADGAFTYDYDAEGNLIRRTAVDTGNVTTFTYDHRNRLVAVVERTTGGETVHAAEFTYDVFDRRIARTVDGVTTYFVYTGARAWADFDAAGTVTARYLYGLEAADDLLARQRPGEGVVWYLADHLYSVRDLIDRDGNLIDHIDYDSFGNVVAETDSSAGDRFKFNGREYEPELGLYSYRARFYDPRLGRFINEDSLGLGGGDPNLYRYVFNAPTNYTDPTGHLAALEGTLLLVRFIEPLFSADVQCWTSAGLEVTVGAGVPFTDLSYYTVLAVLPGGFPTPNAGWFSVQVRSCAQLPNAAFLSGVFTEVGAILHFLTFQFKGEPIDCVQVESILSAGLPSDFQTTARVACRDGPNRYTEKNGFEIPVIPVGGWLGLKDGDHDNCFVAGTQVLVADGGLAAGGDPWAAWYGDHKGTLALASLGVGLALVAAPRRSRKEDEKKTDDVFLGLPTPRPEEDEDLPDGEPPRPALRLRPPSAAAPRAPAEEASHPASHAGVPSEGPLAEKAAPAGAGTSAVGTGGRRKWAPGGVFGLFALLAGLLWLNPLGLGTRPERAWATRNIEDIVPGDLVLAWDEDTGEVVPRRVIQVFRNVADHLRIVTIRNADGSEQTIRTTDGHPFWVPDEGWVDAEELDEGTPVRQADGRLGTVVACRYEEHLEGVAIFNFEVEGSHTYFVAAESDLASVLVHNASRPVNGNSRSSSRPNHGYAIYDPQGKLYKYGISGGAIRQLDGKSCRAERQVRKLGPGFTSEILEHFPNRARALDWEWNQVKGYKDIFRKQPRGNTLPKVP
jgi:RHS repeat-associated protein